MYKFHPKALPDTFSISIELLPRLFWTGEKWTEDASASKQYYRREDAIQGSRKLSVKLWSHNLLRVNVIAGREHEAVLSFVSRK